ncbi:nickel/cobalt transporter [Aestuariivirga sp.]|uniref:nickel/cobalt transporter n=1 Tax=Aestuariivirga sp. TaxID=2650926 RepID=UPI0039E600AA
MRPMIAFARYVFAAFLLIGLIAGPALADTQPSAAPVVKIDRRKLLVQPRNPDGSLQVTPFTEDPVLWMRDQQQVFYGSMKNAMHGIASEKPLAASLMLMLVAFAYGVFHAAGPGHGKAVISAWLLATESELRRGILIAFMSSIIQALTAIAVVSSLLLLVAGAAGMVRDVGAVLESASFAMITGVGLYLIWTALRPYLRTTPAPVPVAASPSGHHFEIVNPLPADHVHTENCGCGHAHLPTSTEVQGDWSWRKAFSLAFSVGIRPCSGAFLVLLSAYQLGLYWAGVAATFAMAIGTFITVSAIAALSVYSKSLAMRLSRGNDRWLGRLSFMLRIGGGIAITCLGALMLLASLSGDGPVSG